MRRLIVSSLFLSVVSLAWSAPGIGVVLVEPVLADVGVPTPVKVRASITDSNVIPTGVNVLRVEPNGSASVIATLRDDGTNGDAAAGDGLFTGVAVLSSSSPSKIDLQVSAAFKGTLQRIKSTIESVRFLPSTAPEETITWFTTSLERGDRESALACIVPADKDVDYIKGATQAELNGLAASLRKAVLIKSEPDRRVFSAPAILPSGERLDITFELTPSPGGRWLIDGL